MKQINYIDIHKLKCHERVDPARLALVRRAILHEGVIRRPVIVDRKSMVILDGHHRYTALCTLGAKRVPVAFVRYEDAGIRVYLRRKQLLMRFIKRFVVETAQKGNVFPSKTTRHLIQNRPHMSAVPIEKLTEAI